MGSEFLIFREFMATRLQIFLDENEKLVFGTSDIKDQNYQRRIIYRWEYIIFNFIIL